MPWLLRMPEVAANATEAVLHEWQVEEQAAFSATTVLATVETEKAVVDVEAETDGVLLRTLVPDGAQVPVGTPIAVVGDVADAATDLDQVLAELGVTANGVVVRPERRQVDGLSGAEDGVDGPEDVEPEPAPQSAPRSTPEPAPSRRLFVSPLARRLAKEAGLDVATLRGTGPHGRVLRRDVESASHRAPGSSAVGRGRAAGAVAPGSAGAADVPLSRMRRAIADRMGESKRTVPHFYLRETVRVDELLRMRAQLNESSPVRVSVTDLVVKAAARAHTLVPGMNVVWADGVVRTFGSVDVSVAVATDGGLLAPVVRDADRLSVSALAGTLADLADRARAGRLRQEELEGGSMSVTNLGMFGTAEFAAIINPPQASILAVGAARQEPVVLDGALAVGTVMRVTLSVDHRPVDGVVAAQWMQAFVRLVENPVQILA